MWKSGKESLCNSHNTIKYWVRDVKKKLKKIIKEKEYENLELLIPTLNSIIEEVGIAKKKGIRMEARLIKYFRACTSLGFIRKPAKSKTSINKKV